MFKTAVVLVYKDGSKQKKKLVSCVNYFCDAVYICSSVIKITFPKAVVWARAFAYVVLVPCHTTEDLSN